MKQEKNQLVSIAEPSALEDGSSESVLSSVKDKRKAKTVSFVASDKTTQGYPGSLALEQKPAPETSEFVAC